MFYPYTKIKGCIIRQLIASVLLILQWSTEQSNNNALALL